MIVLLMILKNSDLYYVCLHDSRKMYNFARVKKQILYEESEDV